MDDVELVKKLTALDDRTKSNTHRLDNQEKDIEDLKKTYAIMEKMDYRVGNIEKNITNISNQLDRHEQEVNARDRERDKEKGFKWDKLIDYLFYAILAYALVKLGLK